MTNFQKLIRRMRKKKDAKSENGTRSRRLKHTKRKPLSTKAKIWIAVGGTLAALVIASVITVVVYLNQNFSYDPVELPKDPEHLDIDPTIDWPEGITNIALFGIDSRSDGMKGLSDSIMIISVDAEHNSIKLISVMRDSLVKIEGHGYQKINAAYSFGGPELAIKTLNKTFNLNIMNYATVDFVGMAEIIDAVGGIEVELTKWEVPCVNDGVTESANTRGTPLDYVSEPGVQTLSGVQAVAFSRIRKVPTINGTWDDFGRTERQRLVMTQLFNKALTLQLTQYPNLIKTMLPYVETSLKYQDIYDLAMILLKDGITMKQDRIPTDRMIINVGLPVLYVGSSVYYDLDYASKLIHAFIFDDITFEDYMEANGVEYKRWFNGKLSVNETTDSSSTDTSSQSTDTGTPPDHSTDTDGGGFGSDFHGSGGKGSGGKGSGSGGGEETTDVTDSNTPSDSDSDTSVSGSGGDSTDTGTDTDSDTEDTSSDSSDNTQGEAEEDQNSDSQGGQDSQEGSNE